MRNTEFVLPPVMVYVRGTPDWMVAIMPTNVSGEEFSTTENTWFVTEGGRGVLATRISSVAMKLRGWYTTPLSRVCTVTCVTMAHNIDGTTLPYGSRKTHTH
jgi:hypothetical protein